MYRNLQPLNVCLSYQRTSDLVKLISEDHAIEVEYWKDQLMSLIDTSSDAKPSGSIVRIN